MNRPMLRGDCRRAGHPDLEGLCRALVDWSAELRLLRANRGLATGGAHLAHARFTGRRLGVWANAGRGLFQAGNEAEADGLIF